MTSNLDITSTNLSIFNVQFWVFTSTTIATVLLIGAVIFLNLRIKALGTALCFLQRPPGTLAQFTTSVSPAQLLFDYFQYKPTAAPMNVTVYSPRIAEHFEITDIVLICLFIIFWLYLVRRIYRNLNPIHGFDLYLEIGNDQSAAKIKLIHMRHDVSLYTFSAPQFVSFLTVIGVRAPKLQLVWPSFTASHKLTHLKYTLPEYHRISYFKSLKIQEIIASKFYLLMWAKEADRPFTLIRLIDSDWQSVQISSAAFAQRLNPLAVIPTRDFPIPPPFSFGEMA